MKPFKEIDPVQIQSAAEAIDAKGRTWLVPAGSKGAVAAVNGPAARPRGYAIDFYLEEQGLDVVALDVAADAVVASDGRAVRS